MIGQSSRHFASYKPYESRLALRSSSIVDECTAGNNKLSIIAEYPLYIAKGIDSVVMTKEPAQPSLYIEGARAGSKRFYGSHALSTDDVCVLVYETNISAFRTLFWGPFTCPCFPILFFNDFPERPEVFHLAVVFVTRHKEHAFSFDVRNVTIRHPNGTVSTSQNTIGAVLI
jgi:hypothetical protein